MPLPPALAARLAKRGIISKKSAQQQSALKHHQEQEEVFAESYDDHDDSINQSKAPQQQQQQLNLISNAEALERVKFMGYPCCPNKWNVYHECSLFCQNHWNSRRSTGPDPGSDYAAKHKSMMEKCGSLPEEWQEKWDPGTGVISIGVPGLTKCLGCLQDIPKPRSLRQLHTSVK